MEIIIGAENAFEMVERKDAEREDLNEDSKHTYLLEELFDPITVRVVSHLMVFEAFDYDKPELLRINQCTQEELDKSLAKLTRYGLVQVLKNDKNQTTFRYTKRINQTAYLLDQFTMMLATQCLEDASSY